MTNPTSADAALAIVTRALRPALPGLLLGVLTPLLGFSLGVVFGLNEEPIVNVPAGVKRQSPLNCLQGSRLE